MKPKNKFYHKHPPYYFGVTMSQSESRNEVFLIVYATLSFF